MLESGDTLYFLHLPRTAGTSLTAWLSTHFRHAEICPHFELPVLRSRSAAEISTYRFFAGHFGLELVLLLPRPPRVITWLREPGQRLLSSYRYLRHLPAATAATLVSPFARRQLEQARRLAFADWVRLPYEGYYHHDLMAHMLAGPDCWGDRVLPAAVQTLERLDHFGLVERMEDSVDLLCHQYGWLPAALGLRLNAGVASGPAAISADTMDAIRERNPLDWALYEHAARRFEERWQRFTAGVAGGDGTGGTADASRARIREALEARFVARRMRAMAVSGGWISYAEPVDGRGWMPVIRREGAREGLIRWSGPETESDHWLRLDPEFDYRLEFTLIDVMDDEILESLRFSVNGRSVAIEGRAAPSARFPGAIVSTA